MTSKHCAVGFSQMKFEIIKFPVFIIENTSELCKSDSRAYFHVTCNHRRYEKLMIHIVQKLVLTDKILTGLF